MTNYTTLKVHSLLSRLKFVSLAMIWTNSNQPQLMYLLSCHSRCFQIFPSLHLSTNTMVHSQHQSISLSKLLSQKLNRNSKAIDMSCIIVMTIVINRQKIYAIVTLTRNWCPSKMHENKMKKLVNWSWREPRIPLWH